MALTDPIEMAVALQAAFPLEELEWRLQSNPRQGTENARVVPYVDNRAIMNRLDSVFGIDGWRNEFQMWRGDSNLCGISCRIGGEWITKWDGAQESNFESVKGGLSNAMRRAAVHWGIGRYLYNLEAQWAPVVHQFGKWQIKEGWVPKLPSWALPHGYTLPTNYQPEVTGADEGHEQHVRLHEAALKQAPAPLPSRPAPAPAPPKPAETPDFAPSLDDVMDLAKKSNIFLKDFVKKTFGRDIPLRNLSAEERVKLAADLHAKRAG